MNSETAPIFIVGASRSGTAMVRSIVSNHPEILVSGETHYFDDLRVRMAGFETSPLSTEQRRICEDYFLAISHRPYGHYGDPERSDISREELRCVAQERGEGADAYFESFCLIRSRRAGKRVWGDKTPRHVFRIPEILGRYPDARVLCMVRDPRAVVASYRDWRNQGGFDFESDPGHEQALRLEEARARQSYNILIISLLWRATVRAAVSARDKFGDSHVRVQRYEDMVESPEHAIRDIANWLGVEFHPAMLDVPVHNSSFNEFQQNAGVSKEPMRRWRTKLSKREIGIVQSVCGRVLRRAGYDLEPVRQPTMAIAWSWMSLPVVTARAAMANRDRMGNLPKYVWRRFRLTVGS